MPFTVCTARNRPAPGAGVAGARPHASGRWLQALRGSRLSARNSWAYCARSMASAEHALHGLEAAGRLKRLDHEVLSAGLDRFDDQRLLAHRAAHEDLGLGVVLDDLPPGVDPPHVRHPDAHGPEIGLELLVALHGLPARPGLSHGL